MNKKIGYCDEYELSVITGFEPSKCKALIESAGDVFEKKTTLFSDVDEVMQLTGYGKTKSYELIKTINENMKARGVTLFISGRVLRTELYKELGVRFE